MKQIFIALLFGFLFAVNAQAGDVDAAVREIQSGNCSTGIRHLKEIAAKGDGVAEYNLGYSYRNGICVEKNDKIAFKWFSASARHGLAEAQDRVGWMYANGVGVKRDLRKGAIWSDAAASQGVRHAKVNLAAVCYELG